MALRSLISRSYPSTLASLSLLFSARTFASKSVSLPSLAGPAPFLRLRPLVSALQARWSPNGFAGEGLRCFSTRPTTSSLNDPSPNWSNRPPKETILLDGCDFEHWLVVMEPPAEGTTRDEIIDSYIKTLAQIVGSEEEARKKIYSVSTKHYFAFGALVSEELSYKIKALPGVRWVLPDSYLDVKNKDYGGEPFIDGKAVPYDPKYHEEWVRNNARASLGVMTGHEIMTDQGILKDEERICRTEIFKTDPLQSLIRNSRDRTLCFHQLLICNIPHLLCLPMVACPTGMYLQIACPIYLIKVRICRTEIFKIDSLQSRIRNSRDRTLCLHHLLICNVPHLLCLLQVACQTGMYLQVACPIHPIKVHPTKIKGPVTRATLHLQCIIRGFRILGDRILSLPHLLTCKVRCLRCLTPPLVECRIGMHLHISHLKEHRSRAKAPITRATMCQIKMGVTSLVIMLIKVVVLTRAVAMLNKVWEMLTRDLAVHIREVAVATKSVVTIREVVMPIKVVLVSRQEMYLGETNKGDQLANLCFAMQ